MAEDEGRDDNRGRGSRTDSIAGESSIILADVCIGQTPIWAI